VTDSLATDWVTYAVAGGVAHLELNRPDAANSLNRPLAAALVAAVERASIDDAVGALLVTGAGKRFCAGGDVNSFVEAEDQAEHLHLLASEGDAATRALADLDKPVVAVVQGAVAGAGLGLMLSCDLVVAHPATKFVFAYSGIGLTPDCGVSWLLPRAIGQQRALAFALTGRPLRADQALDWGMVTEVAEDAPARGRELAASLASTAPRALGQARRLMRDGWERPRAAAGAEEALAISCAVQGAEAQTLISRFLIR
jgi:2-(1,2-epoxy-1,2-dihydrophenyl)acetyl-CoA isomerase